MADPHPAKPAGADRYESAVAAFREALAKVRYGTIAVTVHDARVVQFEITEKRRFDA